MVTALIPVIAIESYVLWVWLGTSAAYSVLVVASANVASTIVGVPLSWIFILPLWFLPGVGPAVKALWHLGEKSALRGLVGFCVLLVICFFLSWFIEGWIVGLFLGGIITPQVAAAVFVGNIVTYSMLIAFVVWLEFFAWKNGFDSFMLHPEQNAEGWNEPLEFEEDEEFPAQVNGVQVLSEEVNSAPEHLNGKQNGHPMRERDSLQKLSSIVFTEKGTKGK
jgi:hypothetical protein